MTLGVVILLFVLIASGVVYTGTRLSYYGDVIAERSGLGQAWIGAAALASVTSLPELVTGVSAVTIVGAPEIAVGDIVGSCLFNLLILAMLDLVSPMPLLSRLRIGHVLSASLGAVMLLALALIILDQGRLPSIGWIGASSLVLGAGYLLAMRVIFRHERHADDSVAMDVAEARYAHLTLKAALQKYALYAGMLVVAAAALPAVAVELATKAGLAQSFVGTVFVAVCTSLPEVMVSIGAARLGAWNLAIGNVLGSNLFNVAILAIDDLLYFKGPLLESIDPSHAMTAVSAALMSAIVVATGLYRPTGRMLRFSWESTLLVGVYVLAIGLFAHGVRP
jgi:cation:H+ antiporter